MDLDGPLSTGPKARADWNFINWLEPRGGFPLSVAYAGKAGASADGGMTRNGAWFADGVTAKATPRTIRGDAMMGTLDIDEAEWFSFYAYVGVVTLGTGAKVPGGGASYTYGAPRCAGSTQGIADGWNCDRTVWYTYADGAREAEPFRYARPGDAFVLRDVDCFDGSIGDSGIAAGLTAYGFLPCSVG